MITVEKFTFNPFSENTYIVYNEKKDAFIIDAGNFHPQETALLEDFIKDKQLKIKNILITHAHLDHVFGLQWAFDTYRVPVLLHQIEQEILDRNPDSARRYGFDCKKFNGEIKYVEEGNKLFLGEDEFDVYHLPGHSPGHIAFCHQAQKFIISGDVLFQGSIGRTDLYKADHQQLLESIENKLFTLDPETKVYCGHGSPTNIGFEKENNPFF
ncbi:MAG: MBL fold hydrolase [Flavobacteriales bacterium]|nr:MAG: MBL fold hydrolase [Flavobacteriales bacterium]